MSGIDLSVIIVSYNTADLIGPCLNALMNQTGCVTEIFVVDNASTDSSADFISANFPNIRLFANQKNLGFAAANNQAIPHCRGRYLLFLNPDTVVRQESMAKAIAYMDANPVIGLAGLHILNPDGTDQESISYRYLSQRFTRGELDGLPGKIASVLGAAMIASRQAIIAVGGFDEDYFLYGEDEDLCLRLRRHGLEIGFIPSAFVIHYHGQSERTTAPEQVWRKKIRAEYLFYRKNYRKETINRIVRAAYWQARWRILSLTMSMPLVSNKALSRGKILKYQAIIDELRKLPRKS